MYDAAWCTLWLCLHECAITSVWPFFTFYYTASHSTQTTYFIGSEEPNNLWLHHRRLTHWYQNAKSRECVLRQFAIESNKPSHNSYSQNCHLNRIIPYHSVVQPLQWSGTLRSNCDYSQHSCLLGGGSPEARRADIRGRRPTAGQVLLGSGQRAPPHQLRRLGERCQRGSGQNPDHKYIFDLLRA